MTTPAHEIRVADLMTRSVHTLTPMQSLPLAESMMGLLHVRHVPVVDSTGRLVGLVTHRDLLAAKLSALSPLSDDERSELQLSVPVDRLMQTNVWTIAPDALAVSAATIMREHRFGCLPVVEDGLLVGILTESDLLALVTDSLSLERRHVPSSATWTMEQVMTPLPVTITRDTSVSDARSKMELYGIRHLPVVENGHPVSMVSDRELTVAEAIFTESSRTRAAHVVRLLGDASAPRVALEAPVEAVLREMFRDRLDAVLVVDGDRLAGIFTATDACRLLAEGLGSSSSTAWERSSSTSGTRRESLPSNAAASSAFPSSKGETP
jgi:CBS domain-containing membrane protein